MLKSKKIWYLVAILLTFALIFYGVKSWFLKSSSLSNLVSSCSEVKTPKNLSLLEIQTELNKFIPISNQLPQEKNGALNRNTDQYISVRFQNEIYYMAANAIENKQIEQLDKFFKITDYSFSFQNEDGSFQFIQPKGVQQTPTKADLMSGAIFFLSSFSISLVILSQSEWFNQLPNNSDYKIKLNSYKAKLAKALDNIISDKQTLIDYDKNASNRLFFDALAFIASSSIIFENSEKYLAQGNEFLSLGLKNQQNQGYFMEKGGFDSSYQGVSLNLLYIIYSINPTETLWKNISCAQSWLLDKVKTDGEVSVEGNSRVGGNGNESFLGQTKTVAAKDIASSFYKYYILTSDQNSKVVGDKIKNHYK